MNTETKNTEQELRELDAWIAVNVFNWSVYTTTQDWQKAWSPVGKFVVVLDQSPTFKFPHYSTDPAAAFQVLEKCIEKSNIAGFFNVKSKTFQITPLSIRGATGTADKLPLAVAKFAKALFSK